MKLTPSGLLLIAGVAYAGAAFAGASMIVRAKAEPWNLWLYFQRLLTHPTEIPDALRDPGRWRQTPEFTGDDPL